MHQGRLGCWLRISILGLSALSPLGAQSAGEAVLHPRALETSVRNPLSGWRGTKNIKPWIGEKELLGVTDPEYGTLYKWYIGWNELENLESDGPEKMKAFFDSQWKDLPARNIRVIPRLVIIDHMGRYHPSDLPPMKDFRESPWYTNAVVMKRIERLITRFASALDRDPRVAFVEMGIQGKYGEQWGLEEMPEFARWLYGLFQEHFKNKKVMVRNVGSPAFGKNTAILKTLAAEFPFGFYQDSFGMEMYRSSIEAVAALDGGFRWQTAVLGGEIRTWKNPIMAASNTFSNVTGGAGRVLVNWARFGHFTFMGWDGNQFRIEGDAAVGGETVRAALGYHFVVPEVRFTAKVQAGGAVSYSVALLNRGSAPFYYPWPVEVALVAEGTRKMVASMRVEGFDLRRVLPGRDWDEASQAWREAPETVTLTGSLPVPKGIAPGNYILTVAILDPEGGMTPNVRLEIENYWKGGLHPLGRIRVGEGKVDPVPDAGTFFKHPVDESISYAVTK